MYTERMKQVGVLGSKAEMHTVIDRLHELGVYHIEEVDPTELEIGSPLPEAEDVDEALVTAKSLKANWDIDGEVKRDLETDEAIAKIQEIQTEYSELQNRREELEQRQRTADAAENVRAALDEIGISEIPETEALTAFTGTVSRMDDALLEEVTTRYDYVTHEDAIVLFVDTDHAEEMRDALDRLDFTPVAPDDGEAVRRELDETVQEIHTFEANKRQAVIDCTAALKNASERAEAPLSFTVSDHTFYITGYAPDADADELREELERVTDGEIYVELSDADDAPVKFANPSAATPFEFFMRLFNLPRYDEIDPTLITAITFPILFGFMLGDIGYGAVVLGIALIGKRYYDFEFFDILAYSAVWTIIFGAAFGEIFGFEEIFGFHLPYIMHRLHSKIELLYVSIAFGLLHVNLGFILGFANEYNRHGLWAAFLEKGGWFVMEIAAGLFALSYLQGLHYGFGLATALVAAFIIYQGEGIQGVVEIPSLLSNTLSYARLMAIGLASAGLAVVVNDSATSLASNGVIGFLGAILIFLLGHSINVCLGILGPTLHSLRLHYVEFFTKFFEGGGKPFKAFGGR